MSEYNLLPFIKHSPESNTIADTEIICDHGLSDCGNLLLVITNILIKLKLELTPCSFLRVNYC